ncbi:hypothetical protein KVR01_002110 [Diaporthe batatas]|uniref:uncharacterized protein n=1 Tax=Diaporthe batatas TaxID=748121 RepID=UPI001D051712|nr:uncharacterized protein KVR01_002110 [Diaporthe batatas]KAG8166421.1 hypothetical protein KVR01_002110 [Diaporthe batatas]
MSTSSTATAPPKGKAAQQTVYTTAGTVYNPTAPPLQPPSRRGRASRWAPPSPAELALLNQSVLASFPYKPYRSPPTTASSLKHYTPLQQNSDRAAEPLMGISASGRTLSESSSTLSLNSAPSQGNTNSLNANGRVLDDMRLTDDEKDEEELTRMSNLPVRTITNLASYPNPSQKLAQKALDRARETFKTAAETDRSSTPSFSQQGAHGMPLPAKDYIESFMSAANPRTSLAFRTGRPEGRFPPTPEELQLRDARSKIAFYGAYQDLTKTLDMRITEAQRKLHDLELGFTGSRERTAARNAEVEVLFHSATLGKPREDIDVEAVHNLPAHEAATPLINMAFSTLLNYWADGRLMEIPTGFGRTEQTKIKVRSQEICAGHRIAGW